MQTLGLDELAVEIIKLAAKINAAHFRWLTMLAEFDSRSRWPNGSAKTCAHWLQRKVGFALGTARERLRVAHALQKLPKVSAATARGALSFAKLRAVTRIATAETEEQLLAVALKSTAEDVERAVQAARRGINTQPDSLHRQQPPIYTFNHSWESDGSLRIQARVPAETGKLLLHALDEAAKANPVAKSRAGRANAFVALANQLLKSQQTTPTLKSTQHVVPINEPATQSVPQMQRHVSPAIAA